MKLLQLPSVFTAQSSASEAGGWASRGPWAAPACQVWVGPARSCVAIWGDLSSGSVVLPVSWGCSCLSWTKMGSGGEAAPGLGTGYWPSFTRPRGRPAADLMAWSLRPASRPGSDKGGPLQQGELPLTPAGTAPARSSAFTEGATRPGQGGFLCLRSRPTPFPPDRPQGQQRTVERSRPLWQEPRVDGLMGQKRS